MTPIDHNNSLPNNVAVDELCLDYLQFCDVVGLIATRKFTSLPPTDALTQMVQQQVIPFATRAPEDTTLPLLLQAEVVAAIELYERPLQEVKTLESGLLI